MARLKITLELPFPEGCKGNQSLAERVLGMIIRKITFKSAVQYFEWIDATPEPETESEAKEE